MLKRKCLGRWGYLIVVIGNGTKKALVQLLSALRGLQACTSLPFSFADLNDE